MKTKKYEVGVDRVLKFNKKKEELPIIDKKNGKEAVFTATRWASFRQCKDKVDEQLNMMSQEQDVAYRYHYGGGWHVSMTTGFWCVDLRKWYVRFGETGVKPTKTGIALRLPEWLKLKQIIEYLHRDYPNVDNYTPCFLTHPLHFVGCADYAPNAIRIINSATDVWTEDERLIVLRDN